MATKYPSYDEYSLMHEDALDKIDVTKLDEDILDGFFLFSVIHTFWMLLIFMKISHPYLMFLNVLLI